MKTETIKILLEKKLQSLINLKTNCRLWYKLENKTIWRERLQDYKMGREYKILSEGEGRLLQKVF